MIFIRSSTVHTSVPGLIAAAAGLSVLLLVSMTAEPALVTATSCPRSW